jgi:hypothetical protein
MRSRTAAVLGAILLALFLFRDPLTLSLLTHRPAPRPEPSAEPVQATTDRPPFERRVGARRYRILPRFRFDQSARVMSSKRYRWGREGALLPEDLALAWGPVLAPPYAGRLSFSQFSRFFFWRTRDLSLERGTIVSHTANVHVFPRTTRLKQAVRAVRKGDLVRLEGFLVDIDGVDGDEFHWGTSTSRSDEGPSSCETIYLERLTVGERAYE